MQDLNFFVFETVRMVEAYTTLGNLGQGIQEWTK